VIDRELGIRKLLLVQRDLDLLDPPSTTIDPARIHAALVTALGDLPEWMRSIYGFLERPAGA